MELSVFRNYSDRVPANGTLSAVVEAIATDNRLRDLTQSYRSSGAKGVKQESPLFAVAARFSGGKTQSNITSLTGLSMVDFDHLETAAVGQSTAANGQSATPTGQCTEVGVQWLKQKLCADSHTLLCYTTISGRGLRVIFRYELNPSFTLQQQMNYYSKVFALGNDYYQQLADVVPDAQCKNIGRLSGLAYDPDVYFNADADMFTAAWIDEQWQTRVAQEKQDKRRSREEGRLQARYDSTIRQEVEAEGGVYAPGRHNDYVMRVGYKLNQFGFSKEVAVAWAARTFADYAAAAAVVTSCYDTQPQEHGSRGGQKSPVPSAGNSRTLATVTDIKHFLEGRVRMRFNALTHRVELLLLPHSDDDDAGDWQPICDRVVNTLWSEMSEQQPLRVLAEDMRRIIERNYVEEYHPFKDYLERLYSASTPEANSGAPADVDPIRELSLTVSVRGGPEQQELFCDYLRKWLVGMVAAWVDDTVVNNVILVLIGEQGTYKTTWFNYLLPPELRRYFYTKSNSSRMNRDDLLSLTQYGLVCCEELDCMRPAELNQLKAVVTMPTIDERAPYAHYHEHRKHVASFCGTGNNAQFLSDTTGNRRWLPFEVESIRSPRDHPFDYAAIYREAYRLYREGFRFWFSREEILRLEVHNQKYETPRIEQDFVTRYFRRPLDGERGQFFSVGDIMHLVPPSLASRISEVTLGRAFVRLGFERKKYQGTRGYVAVKRSPEEITSMQNLMAYDAEAE